MIIYKCNCGDELSVIENTEESRNKKRTWMEKHGASLIQKSPKRKVVDKGKATTHGYTRLVITKKKEAR